MNWVFRFEQNSSLYLIFTDIIRNYSIVVVRRPYPQSFVNIVIIVGGSGTTCFPSYVESASNEAFPAHIFNLVDGSVFFFKPAICCERSELHQAPNKQVQTLIWIRCGERARCALGHMRTVGM